MGRFLEIARNIERLPAPPERRPVSSPVAVHSVILVPQNCKPAGGAEPPFDALASAVLKILVEADRPVPHPEIVRRMIAAGHDKIAAKQAIARCQKRRWIEHNLLTGYELYYSR